jgi:hypothetical protein
MEDQNWSIMSNETEAASKFSQQREAQDLGNLLVISPDH